MNHLMALVVSEGGNYSYISTNDFFPISRPETMVFHANASGRVEDWGGLECMRYESEDEAIAGHYEMVARYGTSVEHTEIESFADEGKRRKAELKRCDVE